ncbi:hypothetical protein JHK85_001224 [Glycine max]|nr:hypothetical protein JHK85_001224 [Glycine max]
MPMAELEMKDDIIKENILKSEEDKGLKHETEVGDMSGVARGALSVVTAAVRLRKSLVWQLTNLGLVLSWFCLKAFSGLQEHNHPHTLLLQMETRSTNSQVVVSNQERMRKLTSKLGANSSAFVPNWQIGEYVEIW